MTEKSDLFKQFERQFPDAIDSSLVFDSRADAENYAKNDPTAYQGQIVTYLCETEQTAAIIQPNKSLREITVCGINITEIKLFDSESLAKSHASQNINILCLFE